MRNEKFNLSLFFLLSLILLVKPVRSFISHFFLDYLYFPAVLLKKNIDRLKTWEMEKSRLISVLKEKNKEVVFPAYKIYYYPLFPPYSITFSSPDKIDVLNRVVLQNGNLVGLIEEVKKNRVIARTIFSPGFKIGVIDKRTQIIGVLKSRGEFMLRLEYIPYWSDVKEGDTLLTSGIGGIFPKGIPVGVVHEVIEKEGEVFLEIRVTPLFDPSKSSLFFIR